MRYPHKELIDKVHHSLDGRLSPDDQFEGVWMPNKPPKRENFAKNLARRANEQIEKAQQRG